MDADLRTDVPACPGCVARDRRIAQLESLVTQLQSRIAALEEQLRQLSRSAKRQAAPFSKGPPKSDPKPPGRKAGDDYGIKARRQPPPTIDEVHDALLPPQCPCGGVVVPENVVPQYQTEIPRTPIHRQFNVHIGHCSRCGRRHQGRHRLQTSDALGCCASQLGPDAQAAIVQLNKDAGLSHGKISTLFATLFGITLSRGGACQSMLRTAGKCLPHYHDILRSLHTSPWLVPDETGWRVGGSLAWLHVAVAEDAVAYLVARHRGFEASRRLIPEDYAGTMIHDGWAAYLRFWRAKHQTCLGHLLRRCHEMLQTATRGAVIFPRKVKAILQESLAVRDRREAGQILPSTAVRKAAALRRVMVKLTEFTKTDEANERLAGHLFAQQNNLFIFLKTEGIDATNWRGEQAIRPAVVNRKVWGGNRTEDGAAAQGILLSVLGTARTRGIEIIGWISRLLCSPASAPPLLPAGSG